MTDPALDTYTTENAAHDFERESAPGVWTAVPTSGWLAAWNGQRLRMPNSNAVSNGAYHYGLTARDV
jgi:hypothetical protein